MKTSHGNYYKTEVVTGRAGSPPKPKEEHILQVMAYLDNFNTLPYFKLIYVGRDEFDRTEYTVRLVDVDGDKYPEISYPDGKSYVEMNLSLSRMYNRYKDAIAFAKKGDLPKCDYTPIMTQAIVDAKLKSGEISKAKAKKFSDGETLTTDWRCIAKDTPIKTANSWKMIQNIVPGELVWTTSGFFPTTTGAISTGVRSDMAFIKPRLLMGYNATIDHKILVGISNNHYKRLDKVLDSVDYRTVAECMELLDKGSFLYSVTPIDISLNEERDKELNLEKLFVLGNFISEGSYHYNEDGKTYKVQFTYNVNEKDNAEEVGRIAMTLGATSFKTRIYTDTRYDNPRHSLQLKVYGVEFVRFLQKHIGGRWAHDKYFYPHIMKLNPTLQDYLLHVMLKQDGCVLNMRGSKVENYTSVSSTLALQVQEFYLRNKRIASIVKQKPSGELSKHIGWHVRHFMNATHFSDLIHKNTFYTRIQAITPFDTPTDVYDITVPGPHCFQTCGGMVHNCTYCNFKDVCRGMNDCKEVKGFKKRYAAGEFKLMEYKK